MVVVCPRAWPKECQPRYVSRINTALNMRKIKPLYGTMILHGEKSCCLRWWWRMFRFVAHCCMMRLMYVQTCANQSYREFEWGVEWKGERICLIIIFDHSFVELKLYEHVELHGECLTHCYCLIYGVWTSHCWES